MFIVAVTLVVFLLTSHTAATDWRGTERVATDTVPQLNIEQYVGRWYEVRYCTSIMYTRVFIAIAFVT